MTGKFSISIIIPIYNAEQYIERCLLSVIHQTYQGELECVIVDDCGTDHSIEIADRLIANYKGSAKFRIIHHDHNNGVSASRNTGLNEANGDYVFYLDSDDEITPNCIELLVAQVAVHPKVQCVFGYTVSNPPQIGHFDTSRFAKYQYVENNLWIRSNFYKMQYGLPHEAWNKLFCKKFLLENNIFFNEEISIAEDLLWMYKIAQKLQSLAFVFTTTYIHYYNNEGSLMTTLTVDKDAANYKLVVFDFLECVDNPMQKLQLQVVLMCFSQHQVYRVCDTREIATLYTKAKIILFQEKQYVSLWYLSLWRWIYPLRNIRKLLRFSYEKIK